MSTYSDYEQRLLDQQSGAELDRRAERAMDHVIDVMHKPPEPPDLTKQLIEDIRTEYDAGAQGYFLPRATMRWLLDALCSAERPSQAPCNPELLAALKGIVPAFNTDTRRLSSHAVWLGPPRGIGYAFAYAAAKRMAARNGSTFCYWFAARNPVASSSDETITGEKS